MTLKKALTTSSILVATLWVGLVGGCGGSGLPEDTTDPSLQGDNLSAGESRGGGSTAADEGNTPTADDRGRVTLCHIPPGNHANAHTLTVGQPAVKAHLKHGDTLGACEDDTEADGGTTDPGDGTGGGDAGTPDAGTGGGTGDGSGGGGTPDAGPTCAPAGDACGDNTGCCSGLQCSNNVCTVILG
jgi:hypothetical protein